MDQKVSVIIPNYNGRDLLLKNLPSIVKNCSGCKIIVVDDGSTDDSTNILQNKFQKVKLVKLEKNFGFAKAVNIGVSSTNADLVLLLNTDVSVKENFLKHALKYFDNKREDKTFAVGLCDLSHENGKIVSRGRGGAKFEKGFLAHFALSPQKGSTLWSSGGSSLINRKKFVELGGFDPIFAPFYWEDIDLSFRAWLSGYSCFFEPAAKVDHLHETGSIKKTKSKFYIKSVSYKNQFLFVWKNIQDYTLVARHLLWLPYHFAKSAITFDLAFFAGFFWAILKIPSLVLRFEPENTTQLSDRQVLEKFTNHNRLRQ